MTRRYWELVGERSSSYVKRKSRITLHCETQQRSVRRVLSAVLLQPSDRGIPPDVDARQSVGRPTRNAEKFGVLLDWVDSLSFDTTRGTRRGIRLAQRLGDFSY